MEDLEAQYLPARDLVRAKVAAAQGDFAHAEALLRAAIALEGGFVHLPAGMPHFAFTEEETIVQINGTGPFDVVYIDPKDDPRIN